MNNNYEKQPEERELNTQKLTAIMMRTEGNCKILN